MAGENKVAHTEEETDGSSENTDLNSEIAIERRPKSNASYCKRWQNFHVIIVLLAIVGGFTVLFISSYTGYDHNTKQTNPSNVQTDHGYENDDHRLPQLRSASIYERNKRPRELGQINIYIRESIDDDFRRQPKQFRFPIARYGRQDFPLHGPFLTFTPWAPIFIDRRTRQTIIHSPRDGVFIIPPLINGHGEIYSIGELIYHRYASLVSSGNLPIGSINIMSHFRRVPLYGPGIPRIDPATGGFTGGIRTNYGHFNIPRYARTVSDDYSSDENDEAEYDNAYKPHKYVVKRPNKPYKPLPDGSKNQTTSHTTTPSSYADPSSVSDVCGRRTVDKLKRKYLSSKLPNITHDDDDNASEKNESSKLDSCNCQRAILTPSELREHALFIILHLSHKHDRSVKRACRQLSQLKERLHQLHLDTTLEATLGLGYSTTRKWLSQAKISFPRSYIEYRERVGPTGKQMPETGGDIFVDIRSNRKDLCFELGRQFYRLISEKSIAQLEDTFGFAYMGSNRTGLAKDFIGFEDGNDNPEGYAARAAAALIGAQDDEAIHVGGSFALTQKWRHKLKKWNENSQRTQEKIIGRTKGEGSIEFKPRLATSHVGRTHLEDNDVEIEIVRRSLPYGDLKQHGLFFVSYASNPAKYERLLNSMVGNENGIYDRLMDYSTPITGNYWYIPSITVLEKLFLSTNE